MGGGGGGEQSRIYRGQSRRPSAHLLMRYEFKQVAGAANIANLHGQSSCGRGFVPSKVIGIPGGSICTGADLARPITPEPHARQEMSSQATELKVMHF